jgi:hypothetical protein
VNAPSAKGIYRAMVEKDGMPKLGAAATLLGIRIGTDIVPDSVGEVHRPAFRPGEKNGLSCAATIESLPQFSLPVEWGGLNMRTAVWKIEAADLPAKFVAGDDSKMGRNRHISIGPSSTMDYNNFVDAIEATRSLWRKVTKN